MDETGGDERESGRKRVEDILFAHGSVSDAAVQEMSSYEPVMYKVVKDKASLNVKESVLEI